MTQEKGKRRKSESRTPDEMLRDKARISRLHLRGVSQVEIANRLGMTEAMVSRDLKSLRRTWAKEAISNIEQAIGEELQSIREIEKQAWRGWLRSLRTVETRSQSGGEGQPARATIKKVSQQGDPAFLRVLNECGTRRSKLLGLDKAQRYELTGKDGEAIRVNATVSVDGMAKLFQNMREREVQVREGLVANGSAPEELTDGS